MTIEDLLEEIVGEIQDEYDAEEPMVVRLSDDEARVDGRADVDDLAELFDIELGLEDEDEYDTVGGLIYHRIGGVPVAGRRGRGRRAAADGRDRPTAAGSARSSCAPADARARRGDETSARRRATATRG